jgi:hypothetical protein
METTLHLRQEDREYLRKQQEKYNLSVVEAVHKVCTEHKSYIQITKIVKKV